MSYVWTLITLGLMAVGFVQLERCETAGRRSGLTPDEHDRLVRREVFASITVLAGFLGFALLVVRS